MGMTAPNEETTKDPPNTVAVIAIASAGVGILILPIVLGPLAIICGIVGVTQDNKSRGMAASAIIIGTCEVLYILARWYEAGLFV